MSLMLENHVIASFVTPYTVQQYIIQMASIAYYSSLCPFAFCVPILKQPWMTFMCAMTPILIADYQVDVRLPNMHIFYHLHLHLDVYVKICCFMIFCFDVNFVQNDLFSFNHMPQVGCKTYLKEILLQRKKTYVTV